MACSGIHQSLEELQSGNVTMDGIKQIIKDCPRICDYFYGTEPFDLAGPGVQLSFLIQAVLVVTFGILQSFVSYIMSPHASSSTQLFLARIQAVFDTVCTRVVYLYVATLVTSFVRLRNGPDAFERITIPRLMEHSQASITLALTARIVQKDPAKVKLRAQRWNMAGLWAISQALPMIGAFAKGMSGPLPSAVLSRLCATTHSEDEDLGVLGYPTVTTAPSGKFYLLMTVCALLIMLAICAAVDLFPILAWLKKIFTARLTVVIGVSVWIIAALSGLCLNQWMLMYLRQTMRNAQSVQATWDFGQIVAVGLWVPVFYKLLLTILVYLKPKSKSLEGGFRFSDAAQIVRNLFSSCIEDLYESNMGRAPVLEKATEPKERGSEKPMACKPWTPNSKETVVAGLKKMQALLQRVTDMIANDTYEEASQADKAFLAIISGAADEAAEPVDRDEKDEKDEREEKDEKDEEKASLMQDYKN